MTLFSNNPEMIEEGIRAVRHRLSFGQPREEIFAALSKHGMTKDEFILVYNAALILEQGD